MGTQAVIRKLQGVAAKFEEEITNRENANMTFYF